MTNDEPVFYYQSFVAGFLRNLSSVLDFGFGQSHRASAWTFGLSVSVLAVPTSQDPCHLCPHAICVPSRLAVRLTCETDLLHHNLMATRGEGDGESVTPAATIASEASLIVLSPQQVRLRGQSAFRLPRTVLLSIPT